MGEAKAIASALAERSHPNAGLSSAVGLLLARLNMHEVSLRLFRRAVEQEPENSAHYYNLATAKRHTGDIAGAERDLTRAVELDPEDAEALALRSGLRDQTAADNHVAELKRWLERDGRSPRKTVTVCHALAKELDDLGHYREAFRYVTMGTSLRRRQIEYDVQVDIDVMAKIRSVFDAGRFTGGTAGHIDARPIFVIGMPRSGTTLVERILGSHSVVRGAGELKDFAMELTNAVRTSSATPVTDRLALVAASAEIDAEALGAAYVRSCERIAGDHAHFVDKMPLNFLYAGLIHWPCRRRRSSTSFATRWTPVSPS